jgi:hypothetical protein
MTYEEDNEKRVDPLCGAVADLLLEVTLNSIYLLPMLILADMFS